jgi:hypothetical protein
MIYIWNLGVILASYNESGLIPPVPLFKVWELGLWFISYNGFMMGLGVGGL